MMSALWVLLCATVVMVVSSILVFHRDYEDGLFGRLGLGLMALASLVRVAVLLEAELEMQFNPVAFALWTGLAIFLCRHLYRFLRFRSRGDHAWRKADHAVSGGKQPPPNANDCI